MKIPASFLVAGLLSVAISISFSAEKADVPAEPGETLRTYHIGNSLTRNIPLERLQELFAAVGIEHVYGRQLGGGLQLDQHLVKRGHPGPPGSGEYNTTEPFGEYDQALKNFKFDALILQPYHEKLDIEPVTTEKWPFFEAGSLQASAALIRYALGRTEPGDDRWDRQHANTSHQATDRFYIYATWPQVKRILGSEEKTYAAYWSAPYEGDVHPSREFFAQLVDGLNERLPDLPHPVRMIPAGEVLAVLDEKIRNDELPGVEAFYERVQPYFRKARGPKSPYNPENFQRDAGVLNLYADGVHMNDQPHNGEDSGTIGSYCAAITIHATLTGKSPVGLTVEPYEMFDAEADAELIRAIQETVWDVVAGHPHTGVPAEAEE